MIVPCYKLDQATVLLQSQIESLLKEFRTNYLVSLRSQRFCWIFYEIILRFLEVILRENKVIVNGFFNRNYEEVI